MGQRFYVETLGCPKNQVDSDKLIGTLLADGMTPTDDPGKADLVVVNTCAFIDEARKESIDTILALDDQRKVGGKLVVTGCMAERYGDELAEALPEVDQVAGFGVPVNLVKKRSIAVSSAPIPTLDLLNLPRPKSSSPWAYVKIAEGCDRNCGFCAIPSFRGPQRSRDISSILDEVEQQVVARVEPLPQCHPAFHGRGDLVPDAILRVLENGRPLDLVDPALRQARQHRVDAAEGLHHVGDVRPLRSAATHGTPQPQRHPPGPGGVARRCGRGRCARAGVLHA